MKKLYLFGNWKMNMTEESAKEWCRTFPQAESHIEAAVFVPALLLSTVAMHRPQGLALGMQDISSYPAGAHTGENDGVLARTMGASYCLCGHSERRAAQKEDDLIVAQKAMRALEVGLTPVICVGESLQEREKGLTLKVIDRQLERLKDLRGDYMIAYEPLWAIGTGLTATAEQAEQVCSHIKTLQEVPCLYGGSVNEHNGAELFACEHIDGGLVGGASLNAQSFAAIVKHS